MKFLAAFFLAAVTSLNAQAAPRLNQGGWVVGGSTSLTFATGTTSVFRLSPQADYFVIDNIAAGLAATYIATSGFYTYLISPEITFHMRASEKVVPYLTARPFEVGNFTGGSAYYSSTGILGIKFFLTDSVAFGPAFSLQHFWPKNGGTSSDQGTILGVFSLHI